MNPQFLLVNNGMTELRGHYLETSVSVARAARAEGLRPTMAVHVTCGGDGLPEDLPIYPLFRVDHWGLKVVPEPRALSGLRTDLKAALATPIGAVSSGRVPLADYLAARFAPAGSGEIRKNRLAQLLPRRVALFLRRAVGLEHRVAAAGRRLVPSALYRPASRVWQRIRYRSRMVPVVTSPGTGTQGVATMWGVPEHERHLTALFRQDLERFLFLTSAGPGDHVFLPTAHAREAYAVHQLLADIGPEHAPHFHLEFRHGILTPDQMNAPGAPEDPLYYLTLVHRACFDACRPFPSGTRIRFYADTEELAADYAAVSAAPFGVLPIPFRSELIPEPEPRSGPLRVLYLGDARAEKGFHLLPGLVKKLFDTHVRTGKIQFVFQGFLPEPDPHQSRALEDLSSYAPEHVTVFGKSGFVPPELYYRTLAESDIVLCPYDPVIYRARSSGILAEALAAGKPVVAPSGCWLANQVRPGTGELFTDEASLAEAVRRVCDDYPAYRAEAARHCRAWLERHNPTSLVRQLVGPARAEGPAPPPGATDR